MGKKICLILFVALLCVLGVTTALADESDPDLGYPWRGHAAPFDHLFGNMIDGHQQSQILKDLLSGFIYVEYTGEVDPETGLPVAKKATCASANRTVGWVVKGVPISAMLVNQSPRIWQVDPADLPKQKGYTHFHWTGTPQKPHGLQVGRIYEGYLMKRIAPVPFFWLGGGSSQAGGGSGGCGGDEGGCGGEEGGCTHDDEGGCGGEEGGCTHDDEGGCGGEEGGCTHDDEGGCTHDDEGGCTHDDEGGCSGEEGGCTHDDEGGCTHDDGGGCGDETGGCTGDEGGCSGGGGSGGSSHGGHSGRVVPEGVDSHTNIVTTWDGSWSGCGGCSDGGCGDH